MYFGWESTKFVNLTDWLVETGGITGLPQNGLTSENQREWGIGPLGNTVVLWAGKPSGDQNCDGGFVLPTTTVNNQKVYLQKERANK